MKAVGGDAFQRGLWYVLGGDFNMSPTNFIDGPPMKQVAVLWAPVVPTYAVPGVASTVDYFVIHESLDHAIPD
eukprot:8475302-Pyramimonas_sp.AAC.1